MVFLPDAAELTVPMLDIEDLVVSCLDDEQKRLQGASMPALLMIDASRLSSVLWLRSPTTWAGRLARLIAPEHTFVAVALVALTGNSPRVAMGIGPYASAEVRERMTRWSEQVGLSSSTSESR